MENTLTHWKKNNDSNFISGEDLMAELKGLKKEMLVVIEKFNDAESFDQKSQQKVIKTGLFLKEVGGKSLYKPVILNKTNAKVFIKIANSEYMEKWVNIPVTLFAQADPRHGYVVRFKAYNPPALVLDSQNFNACKTALKAGKTLSEIKLKYSVSPDVEKALIA